jgi:hypothetical protein
LLETNPIGIATKIGQTFGSILQRSVVEAGKETVKSRVYNHRRNLDQVWQVLVGVLCDMVNEFHLLKSGD